MQGNAMKETRTQKVIRIIQETGKPVTVKEIAAIAFESSPHLVDGNQIQWVRNIVGPLARRGHLLTSRVGSSTALHYGYVRLPRDYGMSDEHKRSRGRTQDAPQNWMPSSAGFGASSMPAVESFLSAFVGTGRPTCDVPVGCTARIVKPRETPVRPLAEQILKNVEALNVAIESGGA